MDEIEARHLTDIEKAVNQARAADDAAALIEDKLVEAMECNAPLTMAPAYLASAVFAIRQMARSVQVLVARLRVADNGAAAESDPVDEAGPPASSHRHKFGDDGRCTVVGCDKVRSKRGRPPAEPVLPPDLRTAPLPLGDAAAERFAGGGLGSSGVVRR
jgi:hypothetical protein